MTDEMLMRQRHLRFAARLRFFAVAILVASACSIAALHAQALQQRGQRGGPPPGPITRPGADLPASGGAGPTEEQLKQLVVMLVVKLGDRTFNGAGLIFGQRGDQLYIVTAKHVVREGLQQAESVRVRFRWLPGESKDAKVLDDFDDSLDIAVLAVSGLSTLSAPNLVWNALASPSGVKPGQDVIPIGYPDGRAWFAPQLHSKVQEVTGQYVEFQGELHAGNSGGALVTDDWSIVALVSQIRPPTNQSSRIDRAIEKLKEWGYPVALTERPATGVTQTRQGRDAVQFPINDRRRWRLEFFPPPNAGNVLITTIADGNPACASYNGGDCLWGVTVDQLDFSKLNPLVCGEGHRARWGVTGYEDPKHWCSLAKQLP
jgi:Trypsin-like peptidase domain